MTLNPKERTRLIILARVQEKTMTIHDASQIMGISYRHTRRIAKPCLPAGRAFGKRAMRIPSVSDRFSGFSGISDRKSGIPARTLPAALDTILVRWQTFSFSILH